MIAVIAGPLDANHDPATMPAQSRYPLSVIGVGADGGGKIGGLKQKAVSMGRSGDLRKGCGGKEVESGVWQRGREIRKIQRPDSIHSRDGTIACDASNAREC